MKIIGLLPFKNEEQFLPLYLKNVLPIVDEIIAIDNDSTDNSRQIMEDAGVIVKGYEETTDVRGGWNPGRVRQFLFNYARERKGTHFLCLDADEAFTTNFVPIARDVIEKIPPGKKLAMQWLALWKSNNFYRNDQTVWSNLYKDFVVTDSPELDYYYTFMADGRTIGKNTGDNWLHLPPEQGCVLHYQFAYFNNFHLKQAWKQVWQQAWQQAWQRAWKQENHYPIAMEMVRLINMMIFQMMTLNPEIPMVMACWMNRIIIRMQILNIIKEFQSVVM